MNNNKIRLAAFFGMTAVLLGAFGAHGLKFLLTPEQLDIFKTGVLYQFMHTIAILVFGFSKHTSGRMLNLITLFFSLGILLFSGSLYLLSCQQILGIEHWYFLGPATPFGGMFFILGWMCLIFIPKSIAPNV